MTTEPTLIQLGAVGVGIALLMVLAAVVSLRKARARRARPTDEPVVEPVIEPGAEPELAVTLEDLDPESAQVVTDLLPVLVDDDETVTVRALRAQVRTLEQALAALPAEAMTAPAAPPAPAAEDPAAAYRRQVALTIRALSSRSDEVESTQRTLARVAAALERLEAPEGLARPAIPAPAVRPSWQAERAVAGPSAPSAPLRTLASVVGDHVAPNDEARTRAADVASPTSLEQTPALDGASTMSGPIDPVELERQLVLPVPPPAPAEPKRGKRRLRRSAA